MILLIDGGGSLGREIYDLVCRNSPPRRVGRKFTLLMILPTREHIIPANRFILIHWEKNLKIVSTNWNLSSRSANRPTEKFCTTK